MYKNSNEHSFQTTDNPFDFGYGGNVSELELFFTKGVLYFMKKMLLYNSLNLMVLFLWFIWYNNCVFNLPLFEGNQLESSAIYYYILYFYNPWGV